jgi:hypothetical protein
LTSASAQLPFFFPLDRVQETFFDPVKSIGCRSTLKASGIREDDMVAAYADAARSFFASEADIYEAL